MFSVPATHFYMHFREVALPLVNMQQKSAKYNIQRSLTLFSQAALLVSDKMRFEKKDIISRQLTWQEVGWGAPKFSTPGGCIRTWKMSLWRVIFRMVGPRAMSLQGQAGFAWRWPTVFVKNAFQDGVIDRSSDHHKNPKMIMPNNGASVFHKMRLAPSPPNNHG